MSLVAGTIAVMASAAGLSFYQQHGHPPVLATSVAILATAYSIRKWMEKRRARATGGNDPRHPQDTQNPSGIVTTISYQQISNTSSLLGT